MCSRSVCVGTKTGFKIYSIRSGDRIENIFQSSKNGSIIPFNCHQNDISWSSDKEVQIAERLYASSLVALVTVASPDKLSIWHLSKNKEIVFYSFQEPIVGVKMNRKVIY